MSSLSLQALPIQYSDIFLQLVQNINFQNSQIMELLSNQNSQFTGSISMLSTQLNTRISALERDISLKNTEIINFYTTQNSQFSSMVSLLTAQFNSKISLLEHRVEGLTANCEEKSNIRSRKIEEIIFAIEKLRSEIQVHQGRMERLEKALIF